MLVERCQHVNTRWRFLPIIISKTAATKTPILSIIISKTAALMASEFVRTSQPPTVSSYTISPVSSIASRLDELLAIQAIAYSPELQESSSTFLSFESHTCLVAEEDGVVIGYALAHLHSSATTPPPLHQDIPTASLISPPASLFIHDVATSRPAAGIGQALFRALLKTFLPTLPITLTSVNSTTSFWSSLNFSPLACPPSFLETYPQSSTFMIRPPPRFSLHPPTRALIPNPNGGQKNPISMPTKQSKAVAPELLNPNPTHYITPSTHGFRSLAK